MDKRRTSRLRLSRRQPLPIGTRNSLCEYLNRFTHGALHCLVLVHWNLYFRLFNEKSFSFMIHKCTDTCSCVYWHLYSWYSSNSLFTFLYISWYHSSGLCVTNTEPIVITDLATPPPINSKASIIVSHIFQLSQCFCGVEVPVQYCVKPGVQYDATLFDFDADTVTP